MKLTPRRCNPLERTGCIDELGQAAIGAAPVPDNELIESPELERRRALLLDLLVNEPRAECEEFDSLELRLVMRLRRVSTRKELRLFEAGALVS